MSKEANPGVIGAFVLGGLVLFAALVLIIVGDSFNREASRFVIYFENSINGLNVGSNVMFRGVPIGYVSGIEAVLDPETLDVTVPVYIDIVTPPRGVEELTDNALDDMVASGLRASLQSESLITGQLYIELDFYPDTEAVYRGENAPFDEIPSIQSGIQAVIEQAQNFVADIQAEVDIPELARELRETLDGINGLVNSEATQNLTSEAEGTLTALTDAANSIERVFANLEPGSTDVIPQVLASLDQVQAILESLEENTRSDSEVAYRFKSTLQEIEKASRSIRLLTDYLEQHPEALIKGKQAQE